MARINALETFGGINNHPPSQITAESSNAEPARLTIDEPESGMNKMNPETIQANARRLAAELTANSHGKSISATDLLNRNIESIPCLVEPFLQKVGLAAIVGTSDAGKSAFLRHLCMSIVSGGSHFLGYSINAEHRRAIYVSTEDDMTATAFLLNKQNKELILPPSSVSGLSFVFDTDSLLQSLDEMLSVHPADIVCIDAFSDLYGRSLNQANEVRGFLNDYSQMAQKHQCLILFLHHTGKRTDELLPSKHNVIGSQAFEAKMRLVMELRMDSYDKEIKHLCIVKGNYLPASFKNESYQLIFTENMTFVNTGNRTPFETLAKANDDAKLKYEMIKEYQSQGFTFDDIAKKMGYKSKGSISKIVQKFEKASDVSSTFPKETSETAEETNVNNCNKLPF